MKNRHEILNGTCHIELRRRDGSVLYTIVEPDDLAVAESIPTTWFAHFDKNANSYYVVANLPASDGKRGRVFLHRLLFNSPEGMVVDHINHDTLDNRRTNLRVVTNAQNIQNLSRPYKSNTSGVRGVKWNKNRKKWEAYFKVDGKNSYIGLFDDISEAETAVQEARRVHIPYCVDSVAIGGEQQ